MTLSFWVDVKYEYHIFNFGQIVTLKACRLSY